MASAISKGLCERIVLAQPIPDWLHDLLEDPDTSVTQWEWHGLTDADAWSKRADVAQCREDAGRRLRLQLRDPVTNRPVTGKAAMAYECVRVFEYLFAGRNAVLVLAFDRDNEDEATSFRAGVQYAGETSVVLAEAKPEFEAWAIAGFEATHRAEQDRPQALQRELGFDPVAEPHRLTSNVTGDLRDAKRVLKVLLDLDSVPHPDQPRTRACWEAEGAVDRIRRATKGDFKDFEADALRVFLPRLGAPSSNGL